MATPLRDILTGSKFAKPGIARSVRASRVVECASRVLSDILPRGRAGDAHVISFSNEVVKIQARHSSAARLIRSKSREIILLIKEELPDLHIRKVTVVIGKGDPRKEYNPT